MKQNGIPDSFKIDLQVIKKHDGKTDKKYTKTRGRNVRSDPGSPPGPPQDPPGTPPGPPRDPARGPPKSSIYLPRDPQQIFHKIPLGTTLDPGPGLAGLAKRLEFMNQSVCAMCNPSETLQHHLHEQLYDGELADVAISNEDQEVALVVNVPIEVIGNKFKQFP